MRRVAIVLSAAWLTSCGGAAAGRAGAGSGRASEVRRIAVGTSMACVVEPDGALDCDGVDAAAIEALGTVRALEFGDDVGCARTASDKLVCWGVDGMAPEPECFGGAAVEYADVPNVPQALRARCRPRPVDVGEPVADVWVGAMLGCALGRSGALTCWGRGFSSLAAGGADAANRTPRRIRELEPAICGARRVAIADDHGCLIETDGHVACFGRNANGALGDGTATDSLVPVRVQGIEGAVEISVAEGRSCALDAEGAVYCWGQRGLDNVELDRTAVRIPSSVPLVSLSIHRLSTCGLDASGRALCAGANMRGRLGLPADVYVQRELARAAPLGAAVALTAGLQYTCALGTRGPRCAGEVPGAAPASFRAWFVEQEMMSSPPTSPQPTSPPSSGSERCVADADCVLLELQGCCAPCGEWPPGALGAVHRNDFAREQSRTCPEPMACPGCVAGEPNVAPRCDRGACAAVPR